VQESEAPMEGPAGGLPHSSEVPEGMENVELNSSSPGEIPSPAVAAH
jgi:hypothetical protein